VAAAPAVPLAVPVAVPVAPAVAPASPSGSVIAARPPSRRRRRGSGWIIGLVTAILLLLGGAVGAYFLIMTNLNQSSRREINLEEGGNLRFPFPGSAWVVDDEAAVKFKAVQLVLKKRSKSGSNNNLALYYYDYQTRAPSEAELVSEALTKLRNYFKQVEYDLKPREESHQLGGKPGSVLEFQGVSAHPENVMSSGEVWMMTHRGFAYWFFTWGPQVNDAGDDIREQVAAEWPRLRQRFELNAFRRGWQEVPRTTRSFNGINASYRLDYPDVVWTKEDDPAQGAEVMLLGHDPRLSKTEQHESKAARARVFVLNTMATNLDAAVEDAKKDMLERQKKDGDKELYPDSKYEEAPNESIKARLAKDAPGKVGALEGKIVRLQVTNTPRRERFVMLGVARVGGKFVLVECECMYAPEQRDFWEQEFQQLMSRLKAR
jgi:hypothetical protein